MRMTMPPKMPKMSREQGERRMKYTLTFSMTSGSGDEHDAETIFNTKEDAQKALDHIKQKPGPCHSFSIQPYREQSSMAFDEWKIRFG
jgi:hypothetical protein